jgi:hypothetical protein
MGKYASSQQLTQAAEEFVAASKNLESKIGLYRYHSRRVGEHSGRLLADAENAATLARVRVKENILEEL